MPYPGVSGVLAKRIGQPILLSGNYNEYLRIVYFSLRSKHIEAAIAQIDQVYLAVHPPSTSRLVPVTMPAAGDAR